MKKTMIIMLLVVNALLTRAQNNAIFGGGASDGWDKKAFAQAGNAIYTGGSGDGWNYTAFAQATNAIFKGGDGDGWSFSNYLQTSNNIYIGGVGDGWSSASFLQAGNAIYTGGMGDGWSTTNYLQAGNSIYVGGAGDGWASTYRPLGALPVTFTSFTAEKNGSASLLKWQTAKEEGSAYFNVERSGDAINFEKIGKVAAAGNSVVPTSYTYTDRQPVNGYNYYRLQQVDRNGSAVYTPTRMLSFDAIALGMIKAYPVPATNLLTVEMPQALQKEDAVINLSNAIGVMVLQIKLPKNRVDTRKVLDLSGLPAGVYTLQVSSQSFNGLQKIIKQ